MSILIKGLDMPKDCPLCPLAHYNALGDFTGCEIVKWYFDSKTMATSTRPKFCPLVEIDDELFQKAENAYVLQQIRSRERRADE